MKTPRIRPTASILVLSLLFLASDTGPVRSGREETPRERVERINREIAEKGGHWTAGITRVGSLSWEERQKMMGFRVPTEEELARAPIAEITASAALPEQFDWRGLDGVSPAKDQGSCGSCWAFAAVGQLEAFALIYDLRLLDLSEQAIMACNSVDQGCNGGFTSTAYDIFMSYGAVDESCMPYEARDGLDCLMYGCEPLATIDDYFLISPPTVANIKQAIYDHGPVACGMYSPDNLSNYHSGCFDEDHPDLPNHGVLLVGWDDSACGGEGAWIMKNSWGTDWGYDGFGYIKYNVCSIGYFPYYLDYHESAVLVRLDTPNGGESLDVDGEYEILWTTSRQTPDSISVLLSLDSGSRYDSTVVTGLDGSAESYLWTVPELPVTTARLKVVAWYGGDVGGYDTSDQDFTIKGKPYRYVSPAGGDVYPYSLPRWAAHSIQDAVDAAASGDSVMVEGGITYGGAVIVSKPVWLLGGWDSGFETRDPAILETTISSVGSPVSFQYILAGSCGIDGFTLSGGTGRGDVMAPLAGNYGGGLFIYQASPVVRNNIIRDNGYISPTAASFGGGISVVNSNPVIEDNVIEDNRSQIGGGIYLYQAGAAIRRNRISGSSCHAEYTGERRGGGIYALYSTADLEGNLITGCSGYRYGGGIYCRFSTLVSTGDTISANSTLSNGGGICGERSSLEMYRGVVLQNLSSMYGGGIYFARGSLDMENSIVTLNESSFVGGGVAADSTWGAMRNNTFDRNSGLYSGGNIYFNNTEPTEFKGNLITYGSAYGLHAVSLEKIDLRYNGFFGNTPEEWFLVEPDGTNIVRNPNYADTASLDYHLGAHSGAIDAGDPGGGTDPDGSRADLGAFGGPGADFAAPDHITGLTATVVGDSIRLDWDPCASPDFEQYMVYGSALQTDLPSDTTRWLHTMTITGNSVTFYTWMNCCYLFVGAVDSDGYAGGFSDQAAVCTGDDELAPEVTVLYPNGGEFIETGDTVYVEWIAADNAGIDSIGIWFSDDNGAAFTRVAGGEPNDSIFMWIAPPAVSDSCLIRIAAWDAALNEGWDVSDEVFTVMDLTDVEDGGDDPEIPVFTDRLEQNYPNPFNGTTTIAYTLSSPARVELKVFDLAGRLLRTLERRDRGQGRHSVVWNGKDDSGRPVTSGVYFIRIKAGKFSQTKKIVYMR